MPLPCSNRPRPTVISTSSAGSSSYLTSAPDETTSRYSSIESAPRPPQKAASSACCRPRATSQSSNYDHKRADDDRSSYGSSTSSTSSSSTSAQPHALVIEEDSFSAESSISEEAHYNTEAILAQHEETQAAVSAPPNAAMLHEVKRQFTPFISLGPVIGMVTETTARILAEVSQDCEVKCFLTDATGVKHGVSIFCTKGTPTVFVFDELRADTKYRVSFDIPVPGLVESYFRTLASNWALKHTPARIAVVSSNDWKSSRDTVPHKNDLWKALYEENHREPFHYCLHLGSNVFVDSKDYVDLKNEGRVPSSKNTSVFQDALDFCSGLGGNELKDVQGHIMEMIRNAYRDAWTQPCTRHALANMPNLMICGAMELGQSFYVEDDADEARVFVHRCCYKVYNEYCRALFEDVVSDVKPVRIGQAYHFHAFGDVGIVFVDTKAHQRFHKSRHSSEVPFLGNKQWSDLDYALSEGGYLSLCKVLLVCTTSPVAQVSEGGWHKASESAKLDLAETWNTPAGVAEASLLLSKLFDWKNDGNREVVLLAGSLTDGGLTEITDSRYDKGVDRIQQITAGMIAGDSFTGPASLKACPMANHGIGVYHTFKHKKIHATRAYAKLTIERIPDLGTFQIHASHILGGSKAQAVDYQI